MTKAVRHYIAEASPRQLDLFPQERASCLRSIQSTTHPSALLPAFLAADTVLRTEGYPKFAKWNLGNANKPRLQFVQGLSALVMVLGLVLDLLLILSHGSHFIRIICLVLWWPALMALFLARNGICVLLHCQGLRALRPWEQFPDSETAAHDSDSVSGFIKADDAEKGRVSVDSSRRATFSRIDPLRKASLQAFGPKNNFEHESWLDKYEKQPRLRKVFEPTVSVQNRDLRLLQDRVVLKAFLGAGLASVMLVVASVFIPSAGLF